MNKSEFVPSSFEVPPVLETERFWLQASSPSGFYSLPHGVWAGCSAAGLVKVHFTVETGVRRLQWLVMWQASKRPPTK